ncbi:MAG: outer membrane lipid asymmetry maintenance protein MlaD [Verrucomicrobiota bacterium]|nr:outer membrane lipid asymmetry maintenance protein MlaD [Verrucomicrobiota bacterium]
MNQKRTEFAVGLFILVGILAILYLAIQIGSSRILGSDSMVVEARFSNIGGLNEGSNIMIAGVKVGVVGNIRLDTESLVAMVELKLKNDLIIYDDAIASIKTNGLIGDKYVALDPGGGGLELEEGEPIVDTESALDFESLISRFAFGSLEESE